MNGRIKRGEIYYVNKFGSQDGSEQQPGRPAVIVSNDKNNEHSECIEIVYCTTQPKKPLPTHVIIGSTKVESVVLCEQVTTVFVDKLGDYIGTCTDDEMRRIDGAILVSLGISSNKNETEYSDCDVRVKELEAKLSVYENMYNYLLKMISGKDGER